MLNRFLTQWRNVCACESDSGKLCLPNILEATSWYLRHWRYSPTERSLSSAQRQIDPASLSSGFAILSQEFKCSKIALELSASGSFETSSGFAVDVWQSPSAADKSDAMSLYLRSRPGSFPATSIVTLAGN